MQEEDVFNYMKESLLYLEYPDIGIMTNEQVMDVFQKSNTPFLVAWLLSKYNSCFEEKLRNLNPNENIALIADLVVECGFCSSNDHEKFVLGELDTPNQLLILNKMFKNVQMNENSKHNVTPIDAFVLEQVDNNESFKALDELLNFDINLFPLYGPRKTLNLDERQGKIDGYNKEIEDIAHITSNYSFSKPKVINFEEMLKDDHKIIADNRDYPICENARFFKNAQQNLQEVNDFLYSKSEIAKFDICWKVELDFEKFNDSYTKMNKMMSVLKKQMSQILSNL